MNSLFDRLGLYDFFNVIVAGGIVLLYSIGVANQWCILFRESWILGLFLLLVAYVLGIFCQEIGRFITETRLRIKDRQIGHMLKTKEEVEIVVTHYFQSKKRLAILNPKRIKDFLVKWIRVTDNKCKLEDYEDKFKKICKCSKEDETTLNPDEIKYAFACCIYYIGNRGKNQKVEKMRALYGMAQNLIGAGIMMIISGTVICLFGKQMLSGKVILCSLAATIVLELVGLVRVIVYSKHMIRMTMGVYQDCLENDD